MKTMYSAISALAVIATTATAVKIATTATGCEDDWAWYDCMWMQRRDPCPGEYDDVEGVIYWNAWAK